MCPQLAIFSKCNAKGIPMSNCPKSLGKITFVLKWVVLRYATVLIKALSDKLDVPLVDI